MLAAGIGILGVLPIAFGLGLEIFHHETTINAVDAMVDIALLDAVFRPVLPPRC